MDVYGDKMGGDLWEKKVSWLLVLVPVKFLKEKLQSSHYKQHATMEKSMAPCKKFTNILTSGPHDLLGVVVLQQLESRRLGDTDNHNLDPHNRTT